MLLGPCLPRLLDSLITMATEASEETLPLVLEALQLLAQVKHSCSQWEVSVALARKELLFLQLEHALELLNHLPETDKINISIHVD